MSFSLTITTVRCTAFNIRGMSKAYISYGVQLPGLDINRPSFQNVYSFSVDIPPNTMMPSMQSLANLIAYDCNSRFGGTPDIVVVEGTNYTPNIRNMVAKVF